MTIKDNLSLKIDLYFTINVMIGDQEVSNKEHFVHFCDQVNFVCIQAEIMYRQLSFYENLSIKQIIA